MNINSKGYWEGVDAPHYTDIPLRDFLVDFLRGNEIKTLLDLGCGTADYTKTFLQNRIYCEAYDGNPDTPELTGHIGKVLDLSQPVDLKKTFDCVFSLEVGEHIPAEFEQTFMDNVANHSHNMIILSWAIEGQGGDGHFNERDNAYIINEMAKRYFMFNGRESKLLRDISVLKWFKNTIMVFHREK